MHLCLQKYECRQGCTRHFASIGQLQKHILKEHYSQHLSQSCSESHNRNEAEFETYVPVTE